MKLGQVVTLLTPSLLVASTALAQGPAEPEAATAKPAVGAPVEIDRAVVKETSPQLWTLSTSPLRPLVSSLDFAIERSMKPHVGLSVTGIAAWNSTATAYGAMPQVHFYTNDFDGFEAGGMAVLVAARARNVDVFAAGAGAGAFVGYKLATRFGLTVEAQGGIMAMSATAYSGSSAVATSGGVLPFVDLRMGWSL